MLNIILPSLPYSRALDPMWAAEAAEARRLGCQVCLYDAEQPRLYQPPAVAWPTLYRGWMLGEPEYRQLAALTPLLVSPAQYLASHYATGWYAAVAPLTPRSVFAPAAEAAPAVADFLRADGRCFVKGLAKSFGADSVVTSLADVAALLRKHDVAPGEQLFIREFVALADQPEERFFAVRGAAFGASGQPLPARLRPALAALQSRWLYTVDVAYTAGGEAIIIEIGDGQVSDTKEWQLAELYHTVLRQVAEQAGR
ncbi:ATP-grasp domain-containing protein [Hymenobacter sp. H14-R3]|uniref:ATP-grasp domain-containing protein n=1 Tax=Hymenobacter sp. H14-R3 TaxID=3046308 RepID=UPI0024B8E198|nr:ATP-grasp domain-containing protein [Hymenobacter sp. H14-R3]MDJ0364669.1 ATP-grasp domain-containing protein [Hymenobacter sp. H14-R3]